MHGAAVMRLSTGEILKIAQPVTKDQMSFAYYCSVRDRQYKGIEVFCEALEMIANDHGKPKVKILGTGPELDRLGTDSCARLPNVVVDNRYVDPVPLVHAIKKKLTASFCLI